MLTTEPDCLALAVTMCQTQPVATCESDTKPHRKEWVFSASSFSVGVTSGTTTSMRRAPAPVACRLSPACPADPRAGRSHSSLATDRSRPRRADRARVCLGQRQPDSDHDPTDRSEPASRSGQAQRPSAQAASAAELARRRTHGQDPTSSPRALAKRSKTLSANKAEERLWSLEHRDKSALVFSRDVFPHLADVPLSRLQSATGLSLSACSRIRSGKLTPHQRHWIPLQRAVGLLTREQP